MKPAAITASEIDASAKARIRALARTKTLRQVAAELGTTTEEAYRQCVWAGELPQNVNAHRVPDLQGQHSIPELAARWQVTTGRADDIFRTLESSGFPVRRKPPGQPTSLQLALSTIELFDGSHSIAELVAKLGIDRSVVYDRIRALKRAGYSAWTRSAQQAKPRPAREVGLDLPELPPVRLPEPEPDLGPSAPSNGPSDYVRARMAAMPVAPHSPAVQAILDRLYGAAA